MWTVVAASVTGEVHTEGGNEDAFGFVPESGGGALVRVAVADGHGAEAYTRAGTGARFAVEAALGAPLTPPSVAPVRETVDAAIARWGGLVDEDLGREPHPNGPKLYGTTLIVVTADEQTVVCSQIGDGRVLVLDTHGRVSSPVAADPRSDGTVTASLAGPDPRRDARFARLPAREVRLLLVCTDGYENSFADEAAFLAAATDFGRIVAEHGVGVVREELPAWLSETMSGGSGDDTTVALLIPTNEGFDDG